MNTTTAWARLRAMTAADSAPVLSADEIEALLTMTRLEDSAGLAPSDADWTPTWDFNRAAAEGWRWKLGKLAGSAYDFTADGATFNRSQMVANCEKMIAVYTRKLAGSAAVSAPLALAYPVDEDSEV